MTQPVARRCALDNVVAAVIEWQTARREAIAAGADATREQWSRLSEAESKLAELELNR